MSGFIMLNNIQHQFADETVIKDLNLTIPEGQLFGLLGPSGSGKTTLVKILIGLLIPTEGTVQIANTPMPSLKQLQQIGYMAQSDALYNDLTGKENLDFFASIYGIGKKERDQRIQEAAAVVNLSDNLNKIVDNYSGGMKRRMSLAAALLHRPSLLILDEPTVGIDPVLRASIWDDLKKLQAEGTTIIITTHVMDEADKCDRLALLRDGYVIAQGSPGELKESSESETLEEAFLYYGKSKK
ncbi:ABC transporter ATP-binding protein [Virgibacillus sp. C22-A2]|uniref:ABC transporter ATP-binding protein n=1 Tax=Virgibacillus tibetensis TaxID=3042313 RepID=A0ABU6KHG0_9BACI|nr:ABC transporter ATP-binding protein [Virgibacillus sp. C22-A2]